MNLITQERLDNLTDEFEYQSKLLAYVKQRTPFYVRQQGISHDSIAKTINNILDKKNALEMEIDFIVAELNL